MTVLDIAYYREEKIEIETIYDVDMCEMKYIINKNHTFYRDDIERFIEQLQRVLEAKSDE